jgi:hypothetical protein
LSFYTYGGCCGTNLAPPPCPPDCPPTGTPNAANIGLGSSVGIWAGNVNGQMQFYGLEEGVGTTVVFDATNKAYQVNLNTSSFIFNGQVNNLVDTTTIEVNGPAWVFQNGTGQPDITISSTGIEIGFGGLQLDAGTLTTFTNGSTINFAVGSTLEIGGVNMPANSCLVTNATAGQIAATPLTSFLSAFNPQVGYSVSSAGAPNRTLSDISDLAHVISFLATFYDDISARKLPHT